MKKPTAPRFGYVMNAYPMTSTTFIRTEIKAHEAAGYAIFRYAIRAWPDATLIDPEDQVEQERTQYLLDAGLPRLLGRALREALVNPVGMASALGTALDLVPRVGGRHLYNLVYLLEAVRLKQLAERDGVTHLHAHFSTNSATVPLLAQRLGGPSYSFTVHGPKELPAMRPNGIMSKLRYARFAVAISDYTKGEILKATRGRMGDKVHVVRCGLDLSRFDPAPP